MPPADRYLRLRSMSAAAISSSSALNVSTVHPIRFAPIDQPRA
jgi:hypothetical protein